MKTWLITGSARGLGLAIATAALDNGDQVVATARVPERLDGLASEHADRVLPFALDVTDAAGARAAVEAAVDAFGRLDVVVNNAGYANVDSFEHMDEEDFRAQIETNLFGVVNVTRAALPVLHAQRDGHVIQVSAFGGRHATAGLSPYQTAKWAVGGFSEVLAQEVGPLGIRVTVIEPGGMRTDWWDASTRKADVHPDYEPTVGAFAETAAAGNPDVMRSDPAKVAQAILRVADEEKPPIRLLLGSDAVFLAPLVAAARADEDEEWRELSMSTDHDGVPNFGETPLGKLMQPRPT